MRTDLKSFSNKDEKNDDIIHFTVAGIGGTIGVITGFNNAKTMCGVTTSDRATYIISMGFMGAAVGYVTFITFPVLIPLGLATSFLLHKLDKSKK